MNVEAADALRRLHEAVVLNNCWLEHLQELLGKEKFSEACMAVSDKAQEILAARAVLCDHEWMATKVDYPETPEVVCVHCLTSHASHRRQETNAYIQAYRENKKSKPELSQQIQ